MSEEEKSLISCQICKDVCKRGVSVKCCGAIACRACATKKVTSSRLCWNDACKLPINTDALQNDDDLRCGVDHFKAGTSIPHHILDKLKDSQRKSSSKRALKRERSVSPPSNHIDGRSIANNKGSDFGNFDIPTKKIKMEESENTTEIRREQSQNHHPRDFKLEPKSEPSSMGLKEFDESDSGDNDSDFEDDVIDIDPRLDSKTGGLFANINTFVKRKHKQSRPWVRKMVREHGLTLQCYEGKDGPLKFFEMVIPDYNISIMETHKVKRKANRAAFRHIELLLAFRLNFISFDGSDEELGAKIRTYMNTHTKMANTVSMSWSKQQSLSKRPKKLNKKWSILPSTGNHHPQTSHNQPKQQRPHVTDSDSTGPTPTIYPKKMTKKQKRKFRLAEKRNAKNLAEEEKLKQQNYPQQSQNYPQNPKNYQQQPQNYQQKSKDYDQQSQNYPHRLRDHQQTQNYQQKSDDYQPRPRDYQQQTQNYRQKPDDFHHQPRDSHQKAQNYEQKSDNYQHRQRDYQQQTQNYQQKSDNYQHRQRDYQQQTKNYQQKSDDYQHRPRDYQQQNYRESNYF